MTKSRISKLNQVQKILTFYQDMGVNCFLNEKSQKRTITKNMTQANKKNDDTQQQHQNQKIISKIRREIRTIHNLTDLKFLINNFCSLDIAKKATNTVFGIGNPKASIMFIGEAPGYEEDKTGIPFCGLSGKLLTNILKSINLTLHDYYITNTVFWRPPNNRRPKKEEIVFCQPFVEKQISLIQPKIIVLIGSTAAESLLNFTKPMHQLRKSTFIYNNDYLTTKIKTFVIFHPSYLLRQPKKKKLMFFDIIKVKQMFDSVKLHSNVMLD